MFLSKIEKNRYLRGFTLIELPVVRKRGFTLIELLVVIAIIGILSSIVLVSLDSAKSNARFAQAITTMKSIESAAMMDYISYNSFAPDVGSGVTPRFVPGSLASWPVPPCAGWKYDWENWLLSTNTIGISLRRANNTTLYFYCTDTTGNCAGGTDIRVATNKKITCNE